MHRKTSAPAHRLPAVGSAPGSGPHRAASLRSVALMLSLALALGCAHEVIWLEGAEPQEWTPPPEPLALTIAVGAQSFEAKRLVEGPYLDRVAREVRESGVFQGVIYPVPEGFDPLWELKLLVRDEFYDPDINFWKSAFANFFFPFRAFVYMEEDHTVFVEALLTRRDQIVGSYATQAKVRHRFQSYDARKEAAAAELIVRRTMDVILAGLVADADRINQADYSEAGR